MKTSQIQGMASIEDCLEVCSNKPGCAAVTHKISSGKCWLKTKKFGDVVLPQKGVNSANLVCGGEYLHWPLRVSKMLNQLMTLMRP